MLFKISNWVKTTFGRIVSVLVVFNIFMVVADFVYELGIYAYLSKMTGLYISPLLQPALSLPIYQLAIFFLVLLVLVYLLIRFNFKKKEHLVPVRDKFPDDYEPNDYARKTKWSFKSCSSYYFVPMLVVGYSRETKFTGLCGPYCTKCNHVLRADKGGKFFCINCIKKYKIPRELMGGDFWDKLMAYFGEEYRQGRLKQSS